MKPFKPTRVFVPPPKPSGPKKVPPASRAPVDSQSVSAASVASQAAATAQAGPRVEEKPPVQSRAAPAGDYVLTIERARLVELQKLGSTIEVMFAVSGGPNEGCTATGQFPLSGPGLTVLSEAALGEQLDYSDPAVALQLVGKHVAAKVVHTGNPTDKLSIVRNIRAGT